MTFALLSLLGLAAGFGGLAYGAWLDRADRTRALLLAQLERHRRARESLETTLDQYGDAVERLANVYRALLDTDPR